MPVERGYLEKEVNKQCHKDTPKQCPNSDHSHIRIQNMDPQIGRNARTRGVRNALPKSHYMGDAQRKAEKRARPQIPSDEKHNHWSGKAINGCDGLATSQDAPLKAMSPKLTEKISQIQDREAGHPRNGSLRCEKTQGFLLLLQSVEHRTVVIGVQSAVWRERGDEESWAPKSCKSTK